MPTIRPLRAFRYGGDFAHELDTLISPASRGEPEDRSVVGDVHEFNIRQLIRGEHGAEAAPDEPEFTHAKRLFSLWKRGGVLVRDSRPSHYIWEQRTDELCRRGLVALVRLSEWDEGIIRPHEKTSPAKSKELSKQLSTLELQLSLVLALVPDHSGALAAALATYKQPAPVFVRDGKGVHNRIWIEEDPRKQLALAEALRDEPAVVADGHHRYEAALLHQRERRRQAAQNREHPHDYVMMMLVPASDPGVQCRPSHRVYRELNEGARALLTSLDAIFEITELRSHEELRRFLGMPGGLRYGLVTEGRRAGLLLREGARSDPRLLALPEVLRDVDAAVLRALVLAPIKQALAVDGVADSASGHNRASPEEVTEQAFSGGVEAALLLRPTRAEQVLAVATAGELMPRKSTNFLPKPGKGLLVGSLASF